MPRIPDDVQARIVADYRANTPVQLIADRHRISRGAVYKVLRRSGVERGRTPGARDLEWTQGELDRIAEIRRTGGGVAEIMRAMGAGYERVSRALRQLGDAGKPPPRTRPPTARQVAEQTLGRPLDADERVGFRNGDNTDLRPENLIVKRQQR